MLVYIEDELCLYGDIEKLTVKSKNIGIFQNVEDVCIFLISLMCVKSIKTLVFEFLVLDHDSVSHSITDLISKVKIKNLIFSYCYVRFYSISVYSPQNITFSNCSINHFSIFDNICELLRTNYKILNFDVTTSYSNPMFIKNKIDEIKTYTDRNKNLFKRTTDTIMYLICIYDYTEHPISFLPIEIFQKIIHLII